MHISLDEFEFLLDLTTELPALEHLKNQCIKGIRCPLQFIQTFFLTSLFGFKNI